MNILTDKQEVKQTEIMNREIKVTLKGKSIYKEGIFYGTITGSRYTDGKKYYSSFRLSLIDGSFIDYSMYAYFKDVVNRIKWEIKNNESKKFINKATL